VRVAFWFTRRDDSFRGFVGNPNRHEPWVNKLRKDIRESNHTRNNRRYGVDELKGEINKIKPPMFD
jgi:hypothetical protein